MSRTCCSGLQIRAFNRLCHCGLLLLGLLLGNVSALDGKDIAVVNGTAITAAQLDLYLLTQGVPENQWAARRQAVLEQMIERRLIQELLDSRKITAPTATLDRQLALVEQVLKQADNPEEILSQLGMTRADLQRELALPLAWQRYVRLVVTEAQIAEYFAKHRRELDGTKRQAAQIFLKVALQDEAAATAAVVTLRELKQKINAGELTFAAAARQYSQSPTASKGGDLGTFAFSGQMPTEITKQAFATEVGQISDPFRTTFGVHLLHVIREVPGQYSLEDVRRDVLNQMGQELWEQTLLRLKKSAKISVAAE